MRVGRKQKAVGSEQTAEGRQRKAVSRTQKAAEKVEHSAMRALSVRGSENLSTCSHGVVRTMLQGHRDLKVYQLAFKLAMEIFKETKTFPHDERFSLTSQIRRSSRSVAANIAEGFRKRRYPNMFVSKLAEADAEATETQVWLDFARDCGYLSSEKHLQLAAGYEEVGRMLSSMMSRPQKFTPS